MKGELRAQFDLCSRLGGMTVQEMADRMTNVEYLFWLGLWQAEHDEAVERS